MTVVISDAANATTEEFDRLVVHALSHVARDDDDTKATTRRHLSEFTAANNVSMMGGWT